MDIFGNEESDKLAKKRIRRHKFPHCHTLNRVSKFHTNRWSLRKGWGIYHFIRVIKYKVN
uniref:Uncharacterized protein n=1 Tax=Megaselia scalaris TaxID=36166 RepID=T1GLN7_MEGSC